MFAVGFAAGSVVTFIILAIYGANQQKQQWEEDRNELERYYWIGYKQGLADQQEKGLTIGQLPVSKN